MQETKRMAEEAKRMGQETQERAKRVGEQSHEALRGGFEAASQSFGEVNKSFQALAGQMTEYSKRTLEDVFQAWEQLLRARSFGEIVDIQTRYAQKAYDTHVAEMSKLTELYRDLTRNAAKPVEQAQKRFT
jgi:phasin family protein